MSMPLLSLEPLRAPLNSTLPNYDTDRDDDPGLWLEPAGRNLFDPKPNRVQTWLFPDSMVGIIGPVSFQTWIAPATDLGGGGVQVRAGIFDCDLARTDCDRLVRDTQTVMAEAGEFVPVTFDLGIPDSYTADPTRRLELRMAVVNNQTDDVWVGFDAENTPSTLTVAQP